MSKVAEKNSSAAFFAGKILCDSKNRKLMMLKKMWGCQRLRDNIQAKTEMISSIFKLLEKIASQ